mgnify:CR=1 FL=1
MNRNSQTEEGNDIGELARLPFRDVFLCSLVVRHEEVVVQFVSIGIDESGQKTGNKNLDIGLDLLCLLMLQLASIITIYMKRS